MSLPFTVEEFFGVFRDYNEAVWPIQFALNGLAIAIVAMVVVSRRHSGRVVSAALALLWAWMGLVYHLVYFREVNPAAVLFGAAFIAGAAAFAWAGVVQGRLQFECRENSRCAAGYVLIAYALIVYPAFALLSGHEYPAMPTFGLPCPTTIFTIGVLALLKPPFPRYVFAIPLFWTAVGSQAALLFGMHEDLGLLVAGLAGLWFMIERGREARPA
jgi:hypothetical protein